MLPNQPTFNLLVLYKLLICYFFHFNKQKLKKQLMISNEKLKSLKQSIRIKDFF